MNWRLSGQSQTIVLPLLVDGQFVVPDSTSITLTVRDNEGNPIPSYTQIPQDDVTVTQILLNLPAGINTLLDGSVFESRYVCVDYRVNGVPHSTTYNYRLHNFLPFTVNASTVRALLGAVYEEIPDNEIDLVSSYFELLSIYGSNITSALVRKDVLSLYANQAIALKSAITLCPALPSKLLKGEKQDNAGFTRYEIDFKKLHDDLEAQLNEKLNLISEVINEVSTTLELPILFTVTRQTDRITDSET